MFKSLIDWVLTHPKKFILFISLITIAAGCFVYKNISINTSNTDLLSKELTFRKNDTAFTKEFPQFSNTIMIVIDADKSDVVKEIAYKFKKEILGASIYINDVFYPEELDFFKENGLLYLSDEELEERLDDMVKYQPFISKLSNPTLYNFLDTINLFLSADLSDTYVEKINKLFIELNNNGGYLAWGDIFSNENKSNYREIIYVQPKLNFQNFFPSEDTLRYLGTITKQIKKEYKVKNNPDFYNFDIRLSGTVPMEQDELNTLGGGAKIGITISLILVFVFLFYAFKNTIYLLSSFVTLIIGLIWTTAFALFLFKELNLISIAFAILFIGLGIDFSIHYLLRTYEFSGKKFKEFLLSTNNSISNALLLTAIAIAIGFLSFAFTSFKGLAQLGIIAGTGMFISLFLTLFFLPSFLILIKNFYNRNSSTDPNKYVANIHFFNFMSFFKINSKSFLILAILFFLFSIFNLKNIKFNNEPLKLRNQESASVITMNELIKDKSVNPYSVDVLAENISEANKLKNKISNLIEVKEVTFFKDLIPKNQDAKLKTISQFKDFYPKIKVIKKGTITSSWEIEQYNIYQKLISIEDNSVGKKIDLTFVKELKDNINYWSEEDLFRLEDKMFHYFINNLEKFNKSLKAKEILQNNIPDDLKNRYIGKNKKIRLEIIPFKNLDDQNNKKEFVESVFKVAPNVSGGAFTTYEAGNAIIQSFKEAMIISIFLTTLFLFFTLRNFKKVFIVFINLIAALLFSLSFLTLLGLDLNFANIIALPLLFGLGAATSIQTILRTEKFKTLDDYFNSTTPRAILFSLLTTMGTFFVLSLSSHVGTASMGKLLIISLFSIFLANLTILIPLEKYFFKK